MSDEEIIELFFARSEAAIKELETKYARYVCRLHITSWETVRTRKNR